MLFLLMIIFFNLLNRVKINGNNVKSFFEAMNTSKFFRESNKSGKTTNLFFEISSSPGSIASGLEVFFPFNKNANNFTSLRVTTTINGAQLTKDRFDEPNAAYLFNGKSDFIKTTYNGILGNAKRTLAFWAKLDLSNNNKSGMSAVSWGPGTDGHRFDGYFNFDAIGPTSNIGASAIT